MFNVLRCRLSIVTTTCPLDDIPYIQPLNAAVPASAVNSAVKPNVHGSGRVITSNNVTAAAVVDVAYFLIDVICIRVVAFPLANILMCAANDIVMMPLFRHAIVLLIPVFRNVLLSVLLVSSMNIDVVVAVEAVFNDGVGDDVGDDDGGGGSVVVVVW